MLLENSLIQEMVQGICPESCKYQYLGLRDFKKKKFLKRASLSFVSLPNLNGGGFPLKLTREDLTHREGTKKICGATEGMRTFRNHHKS